MLPACFGTAAQCSLQVEKHCEVLENETHHLQTQLSTQEVELDELRVKVQAAEAHAASKAAGARPGQEEDSVSSKAMRTTTRNVLLAQVCCHYCHVMLL